MPDDRRMYFLYDFHMSKEYIRNELIHSRCVGTAVVKYARPMYFGPTTFGKIGLHRSDLVSMTVPGVLVNTSAFDASLLDGVYQVARGEHRKVRVKAYTTHDDRMVRASAYIPTSTQYEPPNSVYLLSIADAYRERKFSTYILYWSLNYALNIYYEPQEQVGCMFDFKLTRNSKGGTNIGKDFLQKRAAIRSEAQGSCGVRQRTDQQADVRRSDGTPDSSRNDNQPN